MNNKGLSEIISSVLLILVVIVAIGLIVGFVVPMIKDNLSSSKSCFDLNEYFKISEDSCYNTADSELIVERGMQNLEVSGFSVSIINSEGESKNYQVTTKEVTADDGIEMATGATPLTIIIPRAGESKKYKFDTVGNKISIAPLQKSGNVCSPSDFTIEAC